MAVLILVVTMLMLLAGLTHKGFNFIVYGILIECLQNYAVETPTIS